MKRLIQLIKNVNPFLFVFLLLGIRYVVLGAQFGDALVFLSLCSVFAVDKYLVYKKGPDINADVKKQLEDIKTYVTAMSMKQGMKPQQHNNEQQVPGRWF
jgi:hypothetical protein